MKRDKSTVLYVLLVVFLMGATARAQAVTQNPQELREEARKRLEELQREAERARILALAAQDLVQQRGGARGGVPVIGRAVVRDWTTAGGAWWTNTALVERLGLTGDQKAKIERAFENHRLTIVSTTGLLEKEEAKLARFLEAEPLDRNAVHTQIDRVVQARGEMERANSAMTLEMRESLTRAQWMQLQSTNSSLSVSRQPLSIAVPGGRTGGPGQRGTAAAPLQGVRVGANAIAANLISQVEPVYPELARQARVQGSVVLEAEISRDGTVGNLNVLSGHPLLTQAALDAVKQWRYKPTLLNNEPVQVVTTLTVNFALPGGGGGERGTAPEPPPSPPAPGTGGRRGGRGRGQ